MDVRKKTKVNEGERGRDGGITLRLNHENMASAMEFHHGSFHGEESSSDVFGNDLQDVDVWGDVVSSDDDEAFHPKKGTARILRKAIKITELKPPPPPMSPHRPPRTSPAHRRKAMFVKPHLRRSSGSEGDLTEASADRYTSDHGNVLPPMTPRPRMRNLEKQSSNSKIVSPSCEEKYTTVTPLTVAEKRRRRHEFLSLRAKLIGHEDGEKESRKPGSQTFEISSTHTGVTAQMDSSLSSLSLCPSNFTSVSKGSHGDSEHSLDSKDLHQSQASLVSWKKFEKSPGIERDSIPSGLGHKVSDAEDLKQHIKTVLQQCSARTTTPRRGRRHELDLGTDIPPVPRTASSSRTPRASCKSSLTPRSGSKTSSFRSAVQDDGEKPNVSVRSNSCSRLGRSLSNKEVVSPSKANHSDAKPPIRSLSDRIPPSSRPRQMRPTTRKSSGSVSVEMRTRPPTLRRSPSPCIARKCPSGEMRPNPNLHTTRSSSTSSRRRLKYLNDFEIERSPSISKLEF